MRTILYSCAISFAMILGTLLYTDHVFVRPLKAIFSIESVLGVDDVTQKDFFRGDSGSENIIIEYSDFTCFYCAGVRDIFARLIAEYPVKIVYRHFYPHESEIALQKAYAAECVGKLKGNDSFNAYADILYTNRTNNETSFIISSAAELGVSEDQLKECMESKEIKNEITKESDEAKRLGALGTPYIILVRDGKPVKSLYALSYDRMREEVLEVFKDNLEEI